jgi:hypothetical protein
MVHRVQLVFPRLKCLEIDNWAGSQRPLDMKTPVLDSYIEHVYRYHSGGLTHADIKTITQLRTLRVPESATLPRVKLIQLSHDDEARRLLRHLLLNPTHFVELETIEVEMQVEAPAHMGRLVAGVNKKLQRAISLVYTSELRDLYGMVKRQLVSLASRYVPGLITDTSPVWL